MLRLALVLVVACSKPSATAPPAAPAPAPAPTPAPAPHGETDIVALEHDPEAQPPHTPPEPHQAELAANVDAEGSVLFDAKKYAAASAKFRDAFARAPTAKYASDLCRSLYQEGKFDEALTACDAGLRSNPDATLATDINKQLDLIKKDAKAQGVQLRSK
jgi:tetratricopeptide (TPR) repeat protein